MDDQEQNQKDLIELHQLLDELQRRKKYNKFEFAFPDTGDYRRDLYTHAVKFFAAGLTHDDRCVIAANRVGKSFMAGYEMTCHLTGKYPHWWRGRRFKTPIKAWAAGITNETTKEGIQEILFGSFLDPGTGLIPQDDIVKITNKVNAPGAIGSCYVKHYDTNGEYDGDSLIIMKTYDQGPDKFQAVSVHVIWLDEEPKDHKIYEECLLRTTKTSDFPGGIIMLTFTPLFGLSKVVLEFLPYGRHPLNNVNPANDNWSIKIGWDDIPHLTEEEKAKKMKKIPVWQRDARTKGLVPIGDGLIYAVPEQNIAVIPFDPPAYWRRAYGLDVGWKKTAAVWAAQDPADNVWYIYSELYQEGNPPHAIAYEIKRKCKGLKLPGVIDPAANRSRDDGSRLLEEYWDLDLDVSMANNSIDSGIALVWNLLSSGQLKVMSTCTHWFDEFRTYHKDDRGKIPDGQDDHLMDAMRYLVMSGFDLARSVTELYESDEPGSDDNADRWGLRRFY